jgi:eukaryotic-like serine/threonine-protein kinase
MARRCPICWRDAPEGATFCPFDGTTLDDSPSLRALRVHESNRSGAILGGRYRITGFVDKGATARVYLAYDLKDHRAVAPLSTNPVMR